MSEALLTVEDLWVQYETQDFTAKAVNGISFSLGKGETIGLVGETGAGKTTTALSIMGLLPQLTARVTRGKILYKGRNLLELSDDEMRDIKGGQISMIYQDPMTSLNPVLTVGSQVAESLHYHTDMDKAAVGRRVDEIFDMVGIPHSRKNEYPHQFSGGMKQRIVIAMALACNPQVLIADEPTTALDVTIQAQVLEMMNHIKSQGTGLVFITHDLGVIVRMCQNVAIMYAGEIVEYGTTEDIFTRCRHPYTLGLFGSIPSLKKKVGRLRSVPGLMADATDLTDGCKFHPRCPSCMEQCKTQPPGAVRVSETHQVKCHLLEGSGHG